MGGSFDKNKIPWVAWKKVLNSRDNGGLGIGSLRMFNYALLAKWWWRFTNDNRGIWHDVIMSLHETDGGIGHTRVVARRGGTWGIISHLHLYLMRNQVDLNSYLFFRITNGSGLKIMKDALLWCRVAKLLITIF